MRTHTQIIREGGEGKIADLTDVPVNSVRSWGQRNSIPSKHWAVLVNEQLCTAEELMATAAKRAA